MTHLFEIRNDGSSVLTLTPLGTSCGCTTPRILREHIRPGETGQVELLVEAAGRTGRVSEWGLLATGVPDRPHLRLVLSADVVPRLELTYTPRATVRVRPGQTWRHRFEARGRQPRDEPRAELRLAAPRDADGLFAARLDPTDRRTIDGAYDLSIAVVELRLSCPEQISYPLTPSGTQVLRFTFGEAFLEQVIVWEPDFPIVAAPPKVFLPRKPGAVPSHTVRLEASEPFAIVRLSATSDEISATAALNERSTTHELIVAAGAAGAVERPSSKRFEVVVTTDMPAQESVRIPVLVLDAR
ncbi:MAG TPA: DUF1573 domain-containing protein [Pirellulales bacterium]|nr:DUF1573 domain-containing protein [Pirellulales bacterium]